MHEEKRAGWQFRQTSERAGLHGVRLRLALAEVSAFQVIRDLLFVKNIQYLQDATTLPRGKLQNHIAHDDVHSFTSQLVVYTRCPRKFALGRSLSAAKHWHQIIKCIAVPDPGHRHSSMQYIMLPTSPTTSTFCTRLYHSNQGLVAQQTIWGAPAPAVPRPAAA